MGNLQGILIALWLFSGAEAIEFNNAYIQSVKSGECLTIQKDVLFDQLKTNPCTCGPYQFWKMENEEKVLNELAQFPYLDEFYGTPANGSPVGIFHLTGNPWQKWRVHEITDGIYAFVNQHTKKCLREGPEAKIDQWECDPDDNDPAQQWKVIEYPCGKLSKLPSGNFQLKNKETGECAIVEKDKQTRHFAKIVTTPCSCGNNFHFWNFWENKNMMLESNGSNQCWANWEPGYPGITQCTCVDDTKHHYKILPLEDDNFQIVTQKDGRCVFVGPETPDKQLKYKECNLNDDEQKWTFFDSCNPEPTTTPKPKPPPTPEPEEITTPKPKPPPTPEPKEIITKNPKPTPEPTRINKVPCYLIFFFKSGYLDWITPTRYELLIGGRWDKTTSTWITVDGCIIKPGTAKWTIYFEKVKPDFLNILFPGGEWTTWDDVFDWMNIDFFEKWTRWQKITTQRPTPKPTSKPTLEPTPKPTPEPKLPKTLKDIVPKYIWVHLKKGHLNWITRERFHLLIGGRWDPTTSTWITADGRQIKPGTKMWITYFDDMDPSFLNILFPRGKTFDDVFGWMKDDFFKKYIDWNEKPTQKPTPQPTPKPTLEPTPEPKKPKTLEEKVPKYLWIYFKNRYLDWLNPLRYKLLIGGRWNPTTLTWITADGRQIKPGTEIWTTYFDDTDPSFLTILFPNGKTFDDVFGWMNIEFFEKWTGWREVKEKEAIHVQLRIPFDVPKSTIELFKSGRINWLTPDRIKLLGGGKWTGIDYISKDGVQVKPGTSDWAIYFGSADQVVVNELFGGAGSWDSKFSWLSEGMKDVPNVYPRGSYTWDSYFKGLQ